MRKLPKKTAADVAKLAANVGDNRQPVGQILPPSRSKSGLYEVRTFATHRNRANMPNGDLISRHETEREANEAAAKLFKVIFDNYAVPVEVPADSDILAELRAEYLAKLDDERE